MEFNLTRDLCFFDLEATGLNVMRDRIVQIAVIKYFKDGRPPLEVEHLINPGIPIGFEAMEVHGITPKDVAKKPTFPEMAKELFELFANSDLAGYNSNRFDIPMLMEEFARAGYDFDLTNRNIIDVQRIFYKMEPRTLRAALNYYCNEEIENAHDALADVKATISVLQGQLARYENEDLVAGDGTVTERPVQNDMKKLHAFTNDLRQVDVTNRLKYDHDGTIVFNFGKHQGKPVGEVLFKDRDYYHWIMNKEFSVQVKQKVKELLKAYEKSQPNAED